MDLWVGAADSGGGSGGAAAELGIGDLAGRTALAAAAVKASQDGLAVIRFEVGASLGWVYAERLENGRPRDSVGAPANADHPARKLAVAGQLVALGSPETESPASGGKANRHGQPVQFIDGHL